MTGKYLLEEQTGKERRQRGQNGSSKENWSILTFKKDTLKKMSRVFKDEDLTVHHLLLVFKILLSILSSLQQRQEQGSR